VRPLLRRYSRARGTAVRKKTPLLVEQLTTILMAMPDNELAMRALTGICPRSLADKTLNGKELPMKRSPTTL